MNLSDAIERATQAGLPDVVEFLNGLTKGEQPPPQTLDDLNSLIQNSSYDADDWAEISTSCSIMQHRDGVSGTLFLFQGVADACAAVLDADCLSITDVTCIKHDDWMYRLAISTQAGLIANISVPKRLIDAAYRNQDTVDGVGFLSDIILKLQAVEFALFDDLTIIDRYVTQLDYDIRPLEQDRSDHINQMGRLVLVIKKQLGLD